MALGIVSDDEFSSQINSVRSIPAPPPKVPVLIGEVVEIERGRGEGSVAVPDSLRKLLGETAIEEGNKSAQTIANFLGISPSSVSAYKKGATSTASYHEPKKELKRHMNGVKSRISLKASKTLRRALDNITDDKLEGSKASELAAIAKNLSGIVKDMEPETTGSNGNGNGPSIVIFAPQITTEEHYDVVQAKES